MFTQSKDEKKSPGKKIPIWAAGIAIMMLFEKEIHFTKLTKIVLDSGVTDLGKRGSTPSQTLRVDIAKRNDMVEPVGYRSGKYMTRNISTCLKQDDVVYALSVLARLIAERHAELVAEGLDGGRFNFALPGYKQRELADTTRYLTRLATLAAGLPAK